MRKHPLHMCCSSDVVVIYFRGDFWWRRHDWAADRWAPLALPGGPEARRRGSSVTTRLQPKRLRR